MTPSDLTHPQEKILVADNLTKRYRRSHLGRTKITRGVEQLSFEVRPGEVFGLLGLNGSGKTTTIKLALGLLFPTEGFVSIYGYRVPHPFAQRRIGYLPEVPYFYRNLTPVEVLRLYGALSHLDAPSLPDRIMEVLKHVRMDHVAHKPMREFSKGMLQRIGLAQAILHDPDILILDEPVTGLDPLGIRQIRQLLVDLNKKGKTIILSSHSIFELESIATRVAILVEGRLTKILDRTQWQGASGRLEEIFVSTLEETGAQVVT